MQKMKDMKDASNTFNECSENIGTGEHGNQPLVEEKINRSYWNLLTRRSREYWKLSPFPFKFFK